MLYNIEHNYILKVREVYIALEVQQKVHLVIHFA